VTSNGKINNVHPAYAIPGGEVVLDGEGFAPGAQDFACLFQGVPAHMTGASSRRILALVPEDCPDGEVEISVPGSGGAKSSAAAKLLAGKKLAEDMHIVANPAFDPEDGSLILTRSGSRGQHLPVTLFRLEPDGFLEEIPVDMMNPTGVAFAGSGQLFVSNRADGVVCRVSRTGEVIPFASELGIATGIAFDKHSIMYVGDRSGVIYRIKSIDSTEVFATLEPSVSAYHLAFSPDGDLYVTAPGLSSYDGVWRINPSGETSIFYRGLGRPQGLAFDTAGNLYVAACLRGRRGIVRILPDGSDAEIFVAGMNVIGLCFSAQGDMVVATSEEVFSLPLGIHGTLLN
jgi:sugar lactone lactonase YvrE